MDRSNILKARKVQIEYTQGQVEALNKVSTFLKSSNHFFLLAGYSGCGKTTIAENIANYKHATLLAPTNAAVNRLRDKIDSPFLQFSTIHKLLFSAKDEDGNFKKEKSFTVNKTYIIDECSMIDKYILEIIIKDAVAKNCKIIFMGDSFQLEPVGDNPHIFEWENSYPEHFLPENRYELTEVKRYDGSLLKIATEMRINKKAAFEQPDQSDLTSVEKFSKSLANDINKKNSYVVLTSTNSRRILYNKKIRSYIFKNPVLEAQAQNGDVLVSVSNSNNYSNGEIFDITNAILEESFQLNLEIPSKKAATDPKIVSYTALLYKHNRMHTILIPELVEPSMHGQQILKSILDGNTVVSKKTRKLFVIEFTIKRKFGEDQDVIMFNKDVNIATYGYAISCHKAQGQEWDNVYIDAYWLMPVWDSAKWFYTAITRAKCKVEVTNNKYLKIK
jgi:ATP-dependent exoDNAse (exonuclease V) alpha subunit